MRPQGYDEITRFGEDASCAIPTGRLKKTAYPDTTETLFFAQQ
jgi:hypothetical protein